MFAEKMLEGVSAAAWVLGFLAVIGAFASLVIFAVALFKWAGEEDPEEPVSRPEDEIPADVFNVDTLPKYEYKEGNT